MRDSSEQVLEEERRELLAFEKEILPFAVEERTSISDHINIYTKLLTNLTNLNVVIEDEDKSLILLSFFTDEGYETFVLTLINGKTSLSYSEVTNSLMNFELKRKDNECFTSDTSAKVLTARESNPN